MSSSSRKLETYRSFLHPLISVSVSASSVLAVLWCAMRLTGESGPRPLTIITVVAATIVEAYVGNLLFAERAGLANRFRELVIYLVLVFGLASLLRPGGFAGRFVPSLENVGPVLAAGFAWIHAFGIHNRLRGREGLLGRFEHLRGEELRHALIDRQHDMALTVRELRSVRATVIADAVIVGVFAVLAGLGVINDSSLPLGSAAFVMVIVSFAASMWSAGAMSTFIDEYAANGVGISVPFRYQRRRILMIIPLVAAAVGLALLVARPDDLLPFERVVAFFRWLVERLARNRDPFELLNLPQTNAVQPNYSLMRALMEAPVPGVPPLWLRVFAILLRRLALVIGVSVAALLVFGPLFSKSFRNGLARALSGRPLRRLVALVARQLKILIRWWRFARGRRNPSPLAGGRQKAETRQSDTVKPWSPSLRKRRQMDRAVALFSSIARWGQSAGLPYQSNEGAREYLSRIAAVRPETEQDTGVCADAFCEAKFSRERVSREQMRSFAAAAKRITATG